MKESLTTIKRYFGRDGVLLPIILAWVAVSAITQTLLINVREDAVWYMRECWTMAECLRQGQWFGDKPVGLHGFIFKLPTVILYAVLNRPSVIAAISVNIVYCLGAALLGYRFFRRTIGNRWWSFAAAMMMTTSYHFIKSEPTFLRDIPALLATMILLNLLIDRRSPWLVGLALLLLIDAKEMYFYAFLPAIAIWYLLNALSERKSVRASAKDIPLSDKLAPWLKAAWKTTAISAPAILLLILSVATPTIPNNIYNSNLFGLTENEEFLSFVFKHFGSNTDVHKGGAALSQLEEVAFNADGRIVRPPPPFFKSIAVSLWIKTKPGETNPKYQFAYSITDRSAWALFSVSLRNGRPRIVAGVQRGFNGVKCDGNIPIDDGEWHHIFSCFDRDSVLTLFVDGQLTASAKCGKLPRQSRPADYLMVGSWWSKPGSMKSFNGLIDEVYAWHDLENPKLDQQQKMVEALYNGGIGSFIRKTNGEWGFAQAVLTESLDSLSAAFPLEEQAGIRYDVVGNRCLYPVNDPSAVNGINGKCVDLKRNQHQTLGWPLPEYSREEYEEYYSNHKITKTLSSRPNKENRQALRLKKRDNEVEVSNSAPETGQKNKNYGLRRVGKDRRQRSLSRSRILARLKSIKERSQRRRTRLDRRRQTADKAKARRTATRRRQTADAKKRTPKRTPRKKALEKTARRETPAKQVRRKPTIAANSPKPEKAVMVSMTLKREPVDGGSVNPNADNAISVKQNSPVNISAIPAPGFKFKSWFVVSGECAIVKTKEAETSVKPASDSVVNAVFDKIPMAQLTMGAIPDGCFAEYLPEEKNALRPLLQGVTEIPLNTQIAIGVTDCPPTYFSHWIVKGDARITDAESADTLLTLYGDCEVTPSFVTCYQLTLDSSEHGGMASPEAGIYEIDAGFRINIKAKAAAGYSFSHWTADPADAVEFRDVDRVSTSITLNADAVINPVFTQNTVDSTAWLRARTVPEDAGEIKISYYNQDIKEIHGKFRLKKHRAYQIKAQSADPNKYEFVEWLVNGGAQVESQTPETRAGIKQSGTITAVFKKNTISAGESPVSFAAIKPLPKHRGTQPNPWIIPPRYGVGLAQINFNSDSDSKNKVGKQGTKLKITMLKVLNTIILLLNRFYVSVCKIFYPRCFSWLSFPKIVVFPALLMSILLFRHWRRRENQSHKAALPVMYWFFLFFFVARFNFGRYLLVVSPLIFLFFITFLKTAMKNPRLGGKIILATVPLVIIGFFFEVKDLPVKIAINTAFIIALLAVFKLATSVKYRKTAIGLLTIVITGYCVFATGVSLMASYQIGQIGDRLKYGYNAESDKIADLFEPTEKIWLGTDAPIDTLSFYRREPIINHRDKQKLKTKPWLKKEDLPGEEQALTHNEYWYSNRCHRFIKKCAERGISRACFVISAFEKGDVNRRLKQQMEALDKHAEAKLERKVELRNKTVYLYKLEAADQ